MSPYILKLVLLTVVVFLLNLPFGYWRAGVKKFSFKWFLYIHLPVPAVILLRICSDVGFAFYTYPLFAGAFFGGQIVGRKLLYERFCKENDGSVN